MSVRTQQCLKEMVTNKCNNLSEHIASFQGLWNDVFTFRFGAYFKRYALPGAEVIAISTGITGLIFLFDRSIRLAN